MVKHVISKRTAFRAERRDKGRALFQAGVIMADIAAQLNVDRTTVRDWVADLRTSIGQRASYTRQQRAQFCQMHRQGVKIKVIAERLGLPIKTAYQWSFAVRKNGTTRDTRHPDAPR